jgi:hypothetical protein
MKQKRITEIVENLVREKGSVEAALEFSLEMASLTRNKEWLVVLSYLDASKENKA